MAAAVLVVGRHGEQHEPQAHAQALGCQRIDRLQLVRCDVEPFRLDVELRRRFAVENMSRPKKDRLLNRLERFGQAPASRLEPRARSA